MTFLLLHFDINFVVAENTAVIKLHFSSLQTALKMWCLQPQKLHYLLKLTSNVHLAALVLSKGSSTRILADHWPGPILLILANLSQSSALSTPPVLTEATSLAVVCHNLDINIINRLHNLQRRCLVLTHFYKYSLSQGVFSAKSVWELFIRVKKVCDKILQKLQ